LKTKCRVCPLDFGRRRAFAKRPLQRDQLRPTENGV